MPTSQTGPLAEILSGGSLPLTGELIPPRQLAYFRERLKGRIFSFIVGAFKKQQQEDPTITQAAIARRLGRRPEQINRWLSGPSNMTAETISDLVLAICGGEPSLGVAKLHMASPSQTVAELQDGSDNVPPPEPLTADVLSLEAKHTPDNQTMKDVDPYVGDGLPPLFYSDITLAPLSGSGAPFLAISDPLNQQLWATAINQPTMAIPLPAHSLYRFPTTSYPAASGVSPYGTTVSQQGLPQSLAVRVSRASYWQQGAIRAHQETIQPADIAMDNSNNPLTRIRAQWGGAGQIGFSA
jgi:hypothetical protein